MTATAADVVSEMTLATMARDARGLAIDSISAVSVAMLGSYIALTGEENLDFFLCHKIINTSSNVFGSTNAFCIGLFRFLVV